jgi:chromosome segregation ATPase
MLQCADITVIVQSAHGQAQDQQAQTLAEAQAKINKLREERETLEDQLAKQRQATEKADLVRGNVEAHLAEVSRDKKQLESRLEATLASADKDKRQLESRLEAALASADKDKKQLESRLEAAERDKKQLEAHVLEGEADTTKLRKRLGVVERELQQERDRTANMLEIIQELSREDFTGSRMILMSELREMTRIQEWRGAV